MADTTATATPTATPTRLDHNVMNTEILTAFFERRPVRNAQAGVVGFDGNNGVFTGAQGEVRVFDMGNTRPATTPVPAQVDPTDQLRSVISLVREMTPPAPAPVAPAEPQPHRVFARLDDSLSNGGRNGGNIIAGRFTIEELLALKPSVVERSDTIRAEGKNRPWLIMAAVLGTLALIALFLLWALAPTTEELLVANHRASNNLSRAQASELNAANLAARPLNPTVNVAGVTAPFATITGNALVSGGATITGDMAVNGDVHVHKKVVDHQVRYETAPAIPLDITVHGGGSAATCSGTYLEMDDGGLECFTGTPEAAKPRVCEDRYTQKACQVLGNASRCTNPANFVTITCP